MNGGCHKQLQGAPIGSLALLAIICASVMALPLRAQTVLVDFGSVATVSPTNGNYWNNSTANVANLVSSANVASGYGLAFDPATPALVNTFPSPVVTNVPSMGVFNISNAVVDGLYYDTNSATYAGGMTFSLTNLNINQTYDFLMMGTRSSTSTRTTTYTVTGNNTGSNSLTTSGTGVGGAGVDYYNGSGAGINGITTTTGTISVNLKGTAGQFAYLNAMQLTGYVPYTGGGTTNITSAKEYPGATIISNGTTVNANVAGALPTNTLTDLTISGTGSTLALGANQSVASLTGDANAAVNVNANSLSVSGTNSTTYAGSLAGSGSLIKNNTGTLSLSASNSFTGTATVGGGTLALGNVSALRNATLDTGSSGSQSVGFSVGGANTYFLGGLTGADALDMGANSLDVGGNNTSNNYSGVLGGSGLLTKSGTGTLTLSGANTNTGGITVSSGQLNINDASAIGTGTLTFSNLAKFDNTSSGAISNANNNAVAFGNTNTFNGTQALNMGAGNVTLAAGGTRLIVNSTGALTLGGNISGSGPFNKDGIGTLTLAGSNAMTSYTVPDYGTLNIAHTNALANAQLYYYGSGSNRMVTFGLAGANTYNLGALSGRADGILSLGANSINVGAANLNTTNGGVIEGTGALIKSGTGTLVLSGANSYSGGTLLSGGTLRGDTTSLQGAITNNAATIFDTATNGTYAGVMSGTGTVAKTGAGTLTLTATNTYSGATTVGAGKLVVNGAISNSAVTVTNAGTLGGSGTVGALTIANGGKLAPGNSPGTLFAASATWTNGGSYDWEILNASGTAGATNGWDLLDVAGTLTLTGMTNSGFTINLITLSDSTTPGPMTNFNSSSSYSWMIARATTITGFNASLFNVYAGAFSNSYSGTFGITNGLYESDQALFLTYTSGGTPVPEPGTWAAAALLAAGAAFIRRRRKAV